MDSLSQIILGAAVGEVILGKKIGNKAMLWGALAGTIPDLDIISNLWLDELGGLAAHRGISHSITFAVLGSVATGWLVDKFYDTPLQKSIVLVFRTVLVIAMSIGLAYIAFNKASIIWGIAALIIAMGGGFYINNLYKIYEHRSVDATLKEWISLFFWGFFTHTILDCFTVYGTQLFAPFSNYRVAWSTISVADPIYTIPFLICLLTAASYAKEAKGRRIMNWLGIGISSLYLIFTIFNKQNIDKVFADSLERQGYIYTDVKTSPTILNNILWYGVTKVDDNLVFGKYSYFDSDQDINFYTVPVGEEMIADIEDTKVIKTLKWFSDDTYMVIKDKGLLQFNDMRYGRFIDGIDSPDNYIFHFKIKKLGNGKAEMPKTQKGPPPGSEKKIFSSLWQRIKGNED